MVTRETGKAGKSEQNHAEESDETRIMKERAARWASQTVRLVPSGGPARAKIKVPRRRKDGQQAK